MKQFKKLLLATCLLNAGVLHAAETSFNLGLVSLYKSSGVDQDYDDASSTWLPFDEDVRPALQGGVDVDFGNGFYLGNWNSTGKFENGNLEVDLYAGYYGSISDSVSYDLGYATYFYPKASHWNGSEIYGSINVNGVTLKVTNGVEGSLVSNGNPLRRYSIGYDFSLTEQLAVNLTYGVRNKAAGDYNDYAATATYDFGDGVSANLAYSGATKKSDADNHERDDRITVGVVKYF